ncbi:MAG TPA: thioredoxin domain-containing protein [Patescibacteria group bacterium]|nr:thioredoxin domain-containing protein [Patescibacteria group bacterium]
MGDLEQATDANFDLEIAENELPVLIYFTNAWSRDGRELLEILQDIMEKYQGQLMLYRMNTDQSPRISSRFNILTIPTIIVCDKGEEIQRFVGEINFVELEGYLNELLRQRLEIKDNVNHNHFKIQPKINYKPASKSDRKTKTKVKAKIKAKKQVKQKSKPKIKETQVKNRPKNILKKETLKMSKRSKK